MNRSEKAAVIEAIKAKASTASFAVVTDFKGMTVEELTNLRVSLRKAGGEYLVVKNTLARIAFTESTHDVIKDKFHDNCGIAFGFEDPVAVAKAVSDFAKQSILKEFPNYQDFEKSWMTALSKAQLIRDLESNGVFFQDLRKDLGQTDLDEYDIVNHIAFNSRLLTRQERAERARHSQLLQQYDAKQQQILLDLISIYEREGISEIERPTILKTPRFQVYGGLPQIVKSIGGKDGRAGYSRAITNLLYQAG